MQSNQVRLEALRAYGVLDSPNEPEFDTLVREAAALIDAPIALISLLDEHRQWFKAKLGLNVSETPLAISFCTHAVQGPGVFEVQNATLDDRFRDNPLVTGDPSIRYYAGAPLRTSAGTRIGTLCVIDKAPRAKMTDEQQSQLAALADKIITTLEERKRRGVPIHT